MTMPNSGYFAKEFAGRVAVVTDYPYQEGKTSSGLLQLCPHVWVGGLRNFDTKDDEGDMPPTKIDIYCQQCDKTFKLAKVEWYS